MVESKRKNINDLAIVLFIKDSKIRSTKTCNEDAKLPKFAKNCFKQLQAEFTRLLSIAFGETWTYGDMTIKQGGNSLSRIIGFLCEKKSYPNHYPLPPNCR